MLGKKETELSTAHAHRKCSCDGRFLPVSRARRGVSVSGAHPAPVSEPRSCDGFRSVFLSEACQGWLSFLCWPARLLATPACVIPVPQGSRLPAVGGQGAAAPSASIPSPWVAGFDRFSLAHALSALFRGLWHGGGFPSLVWCSHQMEKRDKIRGGRHLPQLLGPQPLSA